MQFEQIHHDHVFNMLLISSGDLPWVQKLMLHEFNCVRNIQVTKLWMDDEIQIGMQKSWTRETNRF